MISVRMAPLQEVREKVFPIIQQHWDEVDQRNDIQTLAPRWEIYEKLEEADMHFSIVAVHNEQYVAYVSNYIQPAMHVDTSTQLISESLFVLPEYRSKGVGAAILQSSKKVGQSMGADYWQLSLKSFQPHDELIKGLGLEHKENLFTGAI